MLLEFKKEDLSLIPEVDETEFGFSCKDGKNIYVIRNKSEGMVVGFANILIECDLAHIKELEILYKYRGMEYGTTFIHEFVKANNIKEITGSSMYSAVDFWTSLGADIENPCDNCYNAENDCCEYSNGELCDDYTGEFTIITDNWN